MTFTWLEIIVIVAVACFSGFGYGFRKGVEKILKNIKEFQDLG